MGEYNYDLNANSDEPETNTHGAYDDTIKNKKEESNCISNSKSKRR